MCKLTEEQIEFARDMCLSGSTYYDACRELETQYGVVINPESLRYYAVRKHKPKESIINKLKGNGIEKVLILSDLHIQRIVPPSYILDVPCPDLKSLYLR